MNDKKTTSTLGMPLKRRDLILFVLLTLVALAEYSLVRNYYAENISPYFPRMWDQTATYHHVYQAHYLIRDHGLPAALAPGGPLADLSFKSTLVPVTGTILTFLFGPDRFSVGLVNFLVFILAQVLIAGTLYRIRGGQAAALGWGLFLLAQSHWINGLFDLRFDYAGLLAFGLAWVAMTTYLARPERKNLVFVCLALGFCAGSRSISLVYSVATAGILFGGFLLIWLFSRSRGQWQDRLRSAGIVFAIALLVIVAYTASQWLSLRSYYGGQIGTTNGDIRWAEVGANVWRDRLVWYPVNWWPHYGKIVQVSTAALVLGTVLRFVFKLLKRNPAPPATEPATDMWPWSTRGALVMLVAATLAVFISSPVVGPNIAVIGMLGVPTSIGLAMLVSAVTSRIGSSVLQRILVCLVLTLGAADWTLGIARGPLLGRARWSFRRARVRR